MNLIKIILAYSEINNKANPPADPPIFMLLNFVKWKLRSMNKLSNFSCEKKSIRGSWLLMFNPQERNIYESSWFPLFLFGCLRPTLKKLGPWSHSKSTSVHPLTPSPLSRVVLYNSKRVSRLSFIGAVTEDLRAPPDMWNGHYTMICVAPRRCTVSIPRQI